MDDARTQLLAPHAMIRPSHILNSLHYYVLVILSASNDTLGATSTGWLLICEW